MKIEQTILKEFDKKFPQWKITKDFDWQNKNFDGIIEQVKTDGDKNIKNFISKALNKQKKAIEKKIWEGTNEWADKAWKLNWLNKKDWYDDTELSSSIANHILKEIKKL